MASRAKAKEEARARRLAEEQARAAQAQRARRLRVLSGLVLSAVVVIAVVVAISAGGGGGGIPKTNKQKQAIVASVSSLLTGIPQSGARLGNPKAPVTMTYYGDLECPICKDFTLSGGFPQLVQNEVRQGKVQVVYKSFETATRNPSTFQTQQVAALAAGMQNHFWDYTELFYHEQGSEATDYVTESYLDSLAGQVPGLNVQTWKSQRQSPSLVSQVSTDETQANGAGLPGTPTLIFTGPSGKKSQAPQGAPTYSDLQASIKQVQ